jgi:hypothetical protein
MKKNIIFLLLLPFLLWGADFCVYEANYPQVKDVNVPVDKATLTVNPRGAYLEMNLELTISYSFESWFFKNYNELEFLWEFTLPDQAVINDFWIWLDDSLLQATIMDRWTAELLFSEVSSPVRNPALLSQSFPDREGQIHYQLRLYPIMRNTPRTFIIQYLIPARPTNESLRVWLPTSQLTSRVSPGVDKLTVRFKSPAKPQLLGAEILNESYSSQDGCWDYDIKLDYNQFAELVYTSPIQNEFYISTFHQDDESFYQLAVYPPETQEVKVPKNFLILVDYNRFNTKNLDGELILLSLKETMQQALNNQDYANIIVANSDLVSGSPNLLSCTAENLDQIFNNILSRSFPAYSNFQILIAAAADFASRQKVPLNVVLITNTDEINLYNYSQEQYADEILGMFPNGTRFNVIDLDNISSMVYNYSISQYETHMQSFYGFLCNKSGGNLFFLRYHSLKNIFAALFYEQVSHFQEVEVQTRFNSGYAYGKHLIALHEGYYPLHFPIMQIGRYKGTWPLNLNILGKVRLDKVQSELTITEGDIIPGEQTLAKIWNSFQVQSLYRETQTNATIMDIMDISIENRIMTPYTSFLVFRPGDNHGYEPGRTPVIVNNGSNEGGKDNGGDDMAQVDSSVVEDFQLKLEAYPNPFNLAVNISLSLPVTAKVSEIELTIFNTLGQKVRDFSLDGMQEKKVLKWDGRDEAGDIVSSGVYFAVLTGADFKKSVKLMLLK